MLFSGMRVLRVLDLSRTNISTLPASVGEMKLLKVLNLRETGIRKVPKCVRSLKSLSYLNVSNCSKAPKWIGELRCLQHLEGNFERLPRGISKVESLRTLRTRPLSLSKSTCMKMRGLEEIRFEVSDESQLRRMEEGILAPLLNLRRLKVWNRIRGFPQLDLPQFPQRMSAMTDLEQLTLYSFAVPSWICSLQNLRYLYLWESQCSDYPELQAMPNLVNLLLWGNRRCRELPKAFGKAGGFPHLRFFTISEFPELEEFPEMEDGAMACLEKLEVRKCEKLNKVGDGLERLKALKEIVIQRSGTDEWREMWKAEGMYWKKVKDINPQITISYC